MSTDLFGSKRFSAKIGESCCRMSTRAISFSVLISSLGYHHFDISQTIRHVWVFPGFCPVFCFTVLPFDLSSAPYKGFTTFLRPLVKFLGFNGVI